jgi:hypothetical protein
MGVCSNCHKHENNQNKKGFMKDTNQSHDKGRPNFSPNPGTWKPRTRTQFVQNVGSNKVLLHWSHIGFFSSSVRMSPWQTTKWWKLGKWLTRWWRPWKGWTRWRLGRKVVGWPNYQATKIKTQSEEDQKMNNLTNESSKNKDQNTRQGRHGKKK